MVLRTLIIALAVEVSPTNSRPKPGTMPFSPSMPGWAGPYNGPSGPPTYPPGLPPAPQVYYSQFYTRNNGRTLSNSNSTSSSLSDDAFLVTEDPNYSEHYHQYQSRVRIVDEQPLIHIPPFYRPPVVPPGSLSIDTSFGAPQGIYSAYNYAPLVSPIVPFKPIGRARSKSEIRHKTANYKILQGGWSLPERVEVYFVGSTSYLLRCLALSDSIYVVSIHTGSSPHNSPPSSPTNDILLPVPPSATLPPKPLTAAEENKKKNFFPISWRVIGGGVLMGSESNGKSFIKPGRSQGENVETMHETFLEDPEPKIEDTSPPKPIKRTRSSSIPPTPSIQHIDTGTSPDSTYKMTEMATSVRFPPLKSE
ncbi:hypothetical protein H0H93_004677 [Arthromyces matolae]|nr:hypothetical protein H0H93_004677 [Arthromyces matolae]